MCMCETNPFNPALDVGILVFDIQMFARCFYICVYSKYDNVTVVVILCVIYPRIPQEY